MSETPNSEAQNNPTVGEFPSRTVIVEPPDHPLADVVRGAVQRAANAFDTAEDCGVRAHGIRELLDDCEAGPSLVVTDIMDGDNPIVVRIGRQP